MVRKTFPRSIAKLLAQMLDGLASLSLALHLPGHIDYDVVNVAARVKTLSQKTHKKKI